MTPAQQKLLFENTARAMGDARPHIKQRHVDNCTRADPAYGAGVATALARLAGGKEATDQRQSARGSKKEKMDARG
jgi:catalase